MTLQTPFTAGRVAVLLAAAALFVALDGPSYAARAVTSADIKNGTISSKDVKDGALKGVDVKDDSLTGDDVRELTLGEVPLATRARSVTANGVTGASVADRSLTSADYAVASGTTTLDFAPIAPRQCQVQTIDTAVSLVGATLLATPGDDVDFATGGLTVHTAHSNVADYLRVVVCNLATATIDPAPTAFDWTALR